MAALENDLSKKGLEESEKKALLASLQKSLRAVEGEIGEKDEEITRMRGEVEGGKRTMSKRMEAVEKMRRKVDAMTAAAGVGVVWCGVV